MLFRSKLKVSDFRHMLILCSQNDVVMKNGMLAVKKIGVMPVRCKIEQKASSMFSPHGATMKDSSDSRTHQVTMRYHPEINISAMAWLYEERLISPPRWFKILKVGQTEDQGSLFYIVDARITERSDFAATPTDSASKGPAVGLPSGVRL